MSEKFKGHPVVPVIVIDNVDHAIPLGEALLEGGIRIIEFTMRTEAAAVAIKAIADRLPELFVGAGTILTENQAKLAIDSGSQFGLAPGVDAEIITTFKEAQLPFIPGVATPTDISAALKLDCNYQKFFPAETLGGSKALKSMAAPFAATGVQFCPTGGVNAGNMIDYLGMPVVFTVGGTWIAKPDDLANGNWTGIKQKAAEAMSIAASL